MKPTKLPPKIALVLTTSRSASCDTSIAAEIVSDAHAVLAVMPTGEWRRTLAARLSGIEGRMEAWRGHEPSEVERKKVTADALHFFGDIRANPPKP